MEMNPIKPDKKYLTADLVAGLISALVNIPQAMAQALLAAVNPILGLNTLMLATPVGALFTGSVFINISTTTSVAVAAGDTLINFPAATRSSALATLVLLIGVFQIVVGLLRMGWVTRFIPFSVMTGFLTGVAVLTIIGQLGDFTGYYSRYSSKVLQLADLLLSRRSVLWATLAIGLLTILLVYGLGATRISKFSLVLSLAISSTVAYFSNEFLGANIKTVGDIADVPRSLPSLMVPNFSLIPELIIPAIALGILALVLSATVSQTYPNPDGKFSNVSRDFLGLGAANLATGFVGGIPAGGSNSGTALLINAGAHTRWANIFSGIFVAIIVLLFGNLVEHVAMPALAGLVIVVGIQIIKPNAIRTVWQTNQISRTIMVLTFLSTLVMPLQYAILLGVVIAIVLFVFQQSNRLRIVEWDARETGWPVEKPAPAQLISGKETVLFIYGNLFYAAADTFEKSLPAVEGTHRAVVILLLRGYEDVGSTVIGSLRRYTQALQAHCGKLILAGVSPALRDQLARTGVLHQIGEENIFLITDTIGESGNTALRAARAWLEEIPTEEGQG